MSGTIKPFKDLRPVPDMPEVSYLENHSIMDPYDADSEASDHEDFAYYADSESSDLASSEYACKLSRVERRRRIQNIVKKSIANLLGNRFLPDKYC